LSEDRVPAQRIAALSWHDWFSGAPKLEGPDNAEEVTCFLDRFITTSGDDPEIHELIQYQRHKHSASCLRELQGLSGFVSI